MSGNLSLYNSTKMLFEILHRAAEAARANDTLATSAALTEASPALSSLGQALSSAQHGIEDRVADLRSRAQNLATAVEDLKTSRKRLSGVIKQISGAIADTQKQTDLNADTVRDLKAHLKSLRAEMKAHEAKLDKVRKWAWVPVYGAVITIKSLINKDVGAIRSLRSAVKDDINQTHQSMDKLAALKTELDQQHRRLSSAQAEELSKQALFDQMQRNVLIATTRASFLEQCRIRVADLVAMGTNIETHQLSNLADDLADFQSSGNEDGLTYVQTDNSACAEALLSFALAVDEDNDYLSYSPEVANVIHLQNRGAFVLTAQAVGQAGGQQIASPRTRKLPVMQQDTLDLRRLGWDNLQVFYVEGDVVWGVGDAPRSPAILYTNDARSIELDVRATGVSFNSKLEEV